MTGINTTDRPEDSAERPSGEAFNYGGYPDKLNIGCGYDLKEGYLNIDLNEFHNPDLIADAAQLYMLPDGYYSEVYAQDILEHIPRMRIPDALKEWARVLKPGGRLNIRTSNPINLAELMKNAPDFEHAKTILQNLFGTQVYNGDYHYYGFTPLAMKYYLREAGFGGISIDSFDDWMIVVCAYKEDPAAKVHAPELIYSYGFSYAETMDGVIFRWSQAQSELLVSSAQTLGFIAGGSLSAAPQEIHYTVNSGPPEHVYLAPGQAREINIALKERDNIIRFSSNYVCCPAWHDPNGDGRLLSFKLMNVRMT